MATKTAYRWNVNGWYFKTIEVAEDPDFPGEYNLPSRSTWEAPPDDTDTQWAFMNTATKKWELKDLDMAGRLAEGLITQDEYDAWFAKQDDEFVSVLKQRADSNANNIALVSDVEAEAKSRETADSVLSENLAKALLDIQSLTDSLAANTQSDADNEGALQTAINALQSTVSALQTAIAGKAAADHTHKYAGSGSVGGAATSAVKLQTARKITVGNASKNFDGSANISFSADEIGAGSDCYPQATTSLIVGVSNGTIKDTTYTPTRDGMFIITIDGKDSDYPYSNGATVTDQSINVILMKFFNADDFNIRLCVPAKKGHKYKLEVERESSIYFA